MRKLTDNTPPNRPVSVADVARHAGVSLGTVSRVINRHPSVAKDLRLRVLASSRAIGFVPKVPHRSIAIFTNLEAAAKSIGYVSAMTSLISSELSKRGLAVELIDIDNINLAYEAHIHGVIGIVFDKRLCDLAKIPNFPIVSVNRPMIDCGVSSVYADHYQQAKMATEYLISRGYTNISLIETSADYWSSQQRVKAFRAVLETAGIGHATEHISYTDQESVSESLSRWNQREVTAILNFSETARLEVLHTLSNTMGKILGNEIATISIEDSPVFQYLSPPQTTIRQPMYEMAQLAVEYLFKQIEEPRPEEPYDIKLESTLVERDSVPQLMTS